MVQRLTYRKRHSYATRSNQHRVVKTPGGKLVYQTTKKRASGPKCPVTGKRIQGSWFHGIIHGTEMGIISVVNHVSRCVTITHLAGRPEIGVVKSAQINLKKLLTTKLIPRLIPWNGTETMGSLLIGIPHLRPTEYKRSRLPRNQRTVNRAYGGVLSGSAVRERIIRAFLVEEQKIVKKVLKIQKAKEKLASKS